MDLQSHMAQESYVRADSAAKLFDHTRKQHGSSSSQHGFPNSSVEPQFVFKIVKDNNFKLDCGLKHAEDNFYKLFI